MKRKLQALAVLLLMGVVKLPLEQRVTQNLRAVHLLEEPISSGAWVTMGQSGLAAVLGGLRGLFASILQLRAHVEFTRVNWAQVDSLYKAVTLLQPRNESYWDEASWHMAYNAAGFYLFNRDQDQKRTPELRGEYYHQHVQRGIEILQEGLKARPDSSRLWERLADIYDRRSYEFKKAGDAYMKSVQLGGSNYALHFAGFAYAKAQDPESWKKAYAILRSEYDKGRSTPGLVEHLKNVEMYLNVPREQRIKDAMPVPKVPQKMMGPLR